MMLWSYYNLGTVVVYGDNWLCSIVSVILASRLCMSSCSVSGTVNHCTICFYGTVSHEYQIDIYNTILVIYQRQTVFQYAIHWSCNILYTVLFMEGKLLSELH